ncbi:hypothetical protein [Rhizobium ruizarguesonis]|uniref:hypothetical protein n=1 Tax=Rhizobium ruizarguesonis TaxID=2081791 RepID=UPI0010304D5A|nr:hypothetical protein [Rhizobium ruizarguesonis]TBA03107.1 hypothetical protein ELH64_01120 [Rhizobium ruizarguesonis]
MRIVLISTAALFMACSANAWETTRDGPLQPIASLTEPEADVKKADAAKAEGAKPFLSSRTIEYPYQTGARLGDGWDYLTNTRVLSQCIEFSAVANDGYQQASLDYMRAVDDETLSLALNINTSAKASGSFAGISGHAGGSFNLESSYKMTSKDDMIVAHASVVNGATYVAAQLPPVSDAAPGKDASPTKAPEPNIAGVRLSDLALRILTTNGTVDRFRAACGDGFVAAIGTGADLYLLYHFTHLDTDTRVKITTSMEAGGGVSGLFDAGGSFGSTMNFTDLISKDRLGIYYVQNGGKIASLPAKVEDVASRVAALPTEALDHGRPLYVVVLPYSVLYNWPADQNLSGNGDIRRSLIRYNQRLQTLFSELQVIISDFRKNRVLTDKFEYVHDVTHGLRAVDYSKLNDDLLGEIARVENAIRMFDISCVVHNRKASASQCKSEVASFVEGISFDDYRYAIQLPIPTNVISPDDLAFIRDGTKEIDERKYRLSMIIYKHWVERPNEQRCALFRECMNAPQRIKIYANIKTSLKMAI